MYMDLSATFWGFLGGSVVKSLPAGDIGLIPGLGRSSGEGNGNPVQYSCLGNPKDRGDWQATVHGVSRVRHNLMTKPPPLVAGTILNNLYVYLPVFSIF